MSQADEQLQRDRFERVFGDCYDTVYRYATRRVPAAAVQDVVSETFLVAWRRFDELAGEPLPWLLGIARRAAANHLRADARRDALVRRIGRQPAASRPGADGAAADRRLAAALASLPERDREALLLVAWDGLPVQDAAKVMGCSAGALSVRLHRARRRLARALADNEASVSAVAHAARSFS